MAERKKIASLAKTIMKLENEATAEREDVTSRLEQLEYEYEMKVLKSEQRQEANIQVLSKTVSDLSRQYRMLLERHTLLLGAFQVANSMTFDDFISIETNKVVQSQTKIIQNKFATKIEALQQENKALLAKIKCTEETNLSSSKTIFTNEEETEDLKARTKILTVDIKESSSIIQYLNQVKDALGDISEEYLMSHSEKNEMFKDATYKYGLIIKKYEDEFFALNSEIKRINEKYEYENEGKKAKENIESSVQPRRAAGGGAWSAVFTLVPPTNLIERFKVRTGPCYAYFGLDISKQNVTAVAYDFQSVYLYSEKTKIEERLCTCEYYVRCLAWNQEGTLLAMGGHHNTNITNTIQIWDIVSRRIIKRLKITDGNDCYCLDWNGDMITAAATTCIFHWNVNSKDDNQDNQESNVQLPTGIIRNTLGGSFIPCVQWSDDKSKLASITFSGYLCIYDEQSNLLHSVKAHEDGIFHCPLLQWCPWDKEVVATCCWNGYLKIWRVAEKVTLINQVKHESGILSIEWISIKKAIMTGHWNNHLVLWKYPCFDMLNVFQGHTNTPWYLALNADKSAVVSKSSKEMIFWKAFDEI
mmetsp:Transcript_34677/g.62457  ORF Transcript_34677/g.62457 Transcript_34677/m.62457 type:complete len:587 (-) Transcript_34677:740-2500(-)|eukprot:CAMPEP_0175040828 /NCGR_PEP_ID=MMETSP0052_2-20121109/1512_1 /TAXON_ID=51329 ORGANISM="Polytomella parva, Strain SAG 63-3" /NCGR_SAMPLE_ID=MMETSP0052_2 /ASSEMBLY_ACC=CAM_ASM_000194 /LENGTH=586 /DNA_ID=CAMNT_0016303147 /DNA_START=227 /DNA_END=1987 /DNA_ORIENTATION=+